MKTNHQSSTSTMILSQIRYLVGLHLAGKGFPPSVIAPTLNILRLIEEELIAVGYDFVNPELEKEDERLSQAIVKMGFLDEDEEIVEFEVTEAKTWKTSPPTESLFDKQDDDLSFLDED